MNVVMVVRNQLKYSPSDDRMNEVKTRKTLGLSHHLFQSYYLPPIDPK